MKYALCLFFLSGSCSQKTFSSVYGWYPVAYIVVATVIGVGVKS